MKRCEKTPPKEKFESDSQNKQPQKLKECIILHFTLFFMQLSCKQKTKFFVISEWSVVEEVIHQELEKQIGLYPEMLMLKKIF